ARPAKPLPPRARRPDAPATRSGETTLSPERATLGRYHLEREIGRGSMGAVYLGRDVRADRPVALKTMALGREFEGAELAEARARFFREAEMAGRLRHPDIVTIFDAGEDQGLAFIAMEYIDGQDLLRHAQPARLLPVPHVLRIVARVARALAYAHTQGIVHRDVKPANVMVDLARDVVKVTDFGIARITDDCRTRTGLVLGTPSFMSPEQMAGRHLDGRTDIYSLGVMLFQLLAGALPHRSHNMAELMRSIVNDTAPDVRTLRPELPEMLANVVALALERRVELRYADGVQFACDLDDVLRLIEPQAAPALARAVSGESATATGYEATARFPPGDPRHNAGH
ncbi:MAG TPA: serine/threonine-protein kinase, partial [Burkholderiaceae bacterium]|nr:serine/threonine-protein kinase [Burkholderiaceae bacterium]